MLNKTVSIRRVHGMKLDKLTEKAEKGQFLDFFYRSPTRQMFRKNLLMSVEYGDWNFPHRLSVCGMKLTELTGNTQWMSNSSTAANLKISGNWKQRSHKTTISGCYSLILKDSERWRPIHRFKTVSGTGDKFNPKEAELQWWTHPLWQWAALVISLTLKKPSCSDELTL